MIDFWNRRLVKDQKEKIERLEAYNGALRKQIVHEQKIIMGERVCTEYCERCIHGIYTGPYDKCLCELECKCKDYLRRETAERG